VARSPCMEEGQGCPPCHHMHGAQQMALGIWSHTPVQDALQEHLLQEWVHLQFLRALVLLLGVVEEERAGAGVRGALLARQQHTCDVCGQRERATAAGPKEGVTSLSPPYHLACDSWSTGNQSGASASPTLHSSDSMRNHLSPAAARMVHIRAQGGARLAPPAHACAGASAPARPDAQPTLYSSDSMRDRCGPAAARMVHVMAAFSACSSSAADTLPPEMVTAVELSS